MKGVWEVYECIELCSAFQKYTTVISSTKIYPNNCVVHEKHWRHTLHNIQSIGTHYFMKLADQLEGVYLWSKTTALNNIAPVCAGPGFVCLSLRTSLAVYLIHRLSLHY